MARLITTIIYLLIVITCHGQDILKQEADSLVILLKKSKPGIERIQLLSTLAEYQIHKPGEEQQDFDSATDYINQAIILNRSLRSPVMEGYLVLMESYLMAEKGKKEEARKLTEKAIGILEPGNNKFYLGKAYYDLSTYYDYKDPQQIPQKIALVEKAIAAFQLAGNVERKAFSLKMLGDLYSIINNNQKAIEALELSLKAYNSIHYTRLQGVYSILGSIYFNIDDDKQALQYELLALKTAEILRDTTMQLCEINNNLGQIYVKFGQRELALKYFRDAFETAKKYNDSYTIALLMVGISTQYAALNRFQEGIDFLAMIPTKYLLADNDLEKTFIAVAFFKLYMGAKQYTNAKPYCDKLLQLENSPVLGNAKSNIYRNVASYYLWTKQYDRARIYLIKDKEFSKKFGASRLEGNERLWYKLDSSQGNFQSAFMHLLAYKAITDSFLNVNKTKQIQQLQVEYETAKKEDSLKLKDKDISLLIQKSDLQQANLKQARLVRNATIAGIILAAFLIVLIYRQYRHKKLSSDIISDKNSLLQHLLTEKEWLLKEVHHRVKNNLHTVICLLESQATYLESDALKANQVSQHRIYAMSLIHQKLYKSEDIKTIDMSIYIPEFLNYLRESFGVREQVRFNLYIESLKLGVSQAIPVALIVNEAVTNSIKYAFPSNKDGIISIDMHERDNKIVVVISDNGIGLDPAIAEGELSSLGLELMRGLSEDIDAQIKFANENGTKITITFEVDPLNENNDLLSSLKAKELQA